MIQIKMARQQLRSHTLRSEIKDLEYNRYSPDQANISSLPLVAKLLIVLRTNRRIILQLFSGISMEEIIRNGGQISYDKQSELEHYNFIKQLIMKYEEESLEALIKLLTNPEDYKANERAQQLKNRREHPQQANQQIENLDIQDYLQLFAHQKKCLTEKRWRKLCLINRQFKIEQESFKHFFTIASQANYRRLQHPGYFTLILNHTKVYPPSFFVAIQKDIPRTFSNTNPFQQSLRNVLYAYAVRNPSLLYCQGMNYIVAYLLINQLSQEHTFWFLACLIENNLPDDYFKDLSTVSITTCIFNALLQEAFPQFKLQMMEVGMEPSMILVPWYVCLFTKGFINSVSAYLMNYLLLECRNYNIGYILLKISFALFAVVIYKPDSFSLTKDFKTFKDIIQTRVFEVSLDQIKQSLDLVELNYEIYKKIEAIYRKQKQQSRSELIKSRGKKIPLPPCSPDYPICFHRIQMQKRLGCIQNALILKNGLNLKDQIVQNYLERQDHQQNPQNIHFTNINQCVIGRLSHICYLAEQQSQLKMSSKNTKLQRQTIHKIQILGEEEEQEVHLSTVQERFAQISSYFQIDQNYLQNQINCDEEFKRQLQEFSIEKGCPLQKPANSLDKNQSKSHSQQAKQKFSLRARLGTVFRKVFEKISDINKIQEIRKSQSQISPHKQ